MQWCSVFHSAIKQESAEVSEEIRAPWSHLAAVPVSFFHCPELREKTVKKSKCMLVISLFSFYEKKFILVHIF